MSDNLLLLAYPLGFFTAIFSSGIESSLLEEDAFSSLDDDSFDLFMPSGFNVCLQVLVAVGFLAELDVAFLSFPRSLHNPERLEEE